MAGVHMQIKGCAATTPSPRAVGSRARLDASLPRHESNRPSGNNQKTHRKGRKGKPENKEENQKKKKKSTETVYHGNANNKQEIIADKGIIHSCNI